MTPANLTAGLAVSLTFGVAEEKRRQWREIREDRSRFGDLLHFIARARLSNAVGLANWVDVDVRVEDDGPPPTAQTLRKPILIHRCHGES